MHARRPSCMRGDRHACVEICTYFVIFLFVEIFIFVVVRIVVVVIVIIFIFIFNVRIEREGVRGLLALDRRARPLLGQIVLVECGAFHER